MTIQKEYNDYKRSLIKENNDDLEQITKELDAITRDMRLDYQRENQIEATHFSSIRDYRLDKYRV